MCVRTRWPEEGANSVIAYWIVSKVKALCVCRRYKGPFVLQRPKDVYDIKGPYCPHFFGFILILGSSRGDWHH